MDKFYEHIKIESSTSYTKTINVEKSSTYAVFTFKNIPSATIITLTISEPLREKLKLMYNKLEIVVK